MRSRSAFSIPLMLTTLPAFSQVQNALDLDGVNDRVVVNGASAHIGNADAFSLACWVYPRNVNANWPDMEPFAGFRDNGTCDFYLLQTYGPTLEGRFRNGTNTVFTIEAGNALVMNAWQHLALTYDGTMLRMYRNGLQIGETSAFGTIVNTTVPLHIGYMSINTTDVWLDGRMDEVTLWRRALTPDELTCLQNYGADPGDPDLKLYYRMDQGLAGGNNAGLTSLLDATGTLNGTLSGFALTGPGSNYVAGAPLAGTTAATICQGESYLLNGQSLTTPGTYVAMVPVASGCDSLVMLDLAVTAVDNGVAQNGAFLVATNNAGPWQWVDCSNGYAPIPGATSQYFTVTADGSYGVVVQAGGCVDTSDCVTVIVTGLGEPDPWTGFLVMQDIQAGRFILEVGSAEVRMDAGLYDATGRMVRSLGRLPQGRSEHSLHDLLPGMYFLRVAQRDQHRTYRLVRP